MDRAWEDITHGDVVPDESLKALHTRCGSDIAPVLQQAGFVGDFLE